MDNTDSRINLKQNRTSCETDSMQVCGEGIDGVTRTIRTDVNNVLATLPSSSAQSQIGRLFSANLGYTIFPDLPSIELTLGNPQGSGRIMYLDTIFGGNTLSPGNQYLTYEPAIEITILRDNIPPGGGAPIGQNLNFGSSVTSVINVGSLVGTTIPITGAPIVARTIQVLGHFSLDFSGKIIIPPGHSISVHTYAYVGEPNRTRINLTVTWYELDAPTA